MPTGSITDQDVTFVETWENIATYQNVIIKLSPRGDEKQEVITGRREFFITTQERIITEDKIRDPKNNPFRNGAFRPVKIPDDLTIEQNPNALSDEQIDQILASSDVAFEQWLETIDSIATLRRMLERAEDVSGVTIKRVRLMENRVLEVRGENRLITMKDGEPDSELQNFLNPKGPKGGQPGAGGRVVGDRPANRGVGGRSADYR